MTPGRPQYMLTSQANELLRMIRRAGLDPADFSWAETAFPSYEFIGAPDKPADMLLYQTEKTFFAFGAGRVVYSPGHQQLQDEMPTSGWTQTREHFNWWLQFIRREAEPSLWDRLTETGALPADTADLPRTHFTSAEQASIRARLDEMTRQIESHAALTQEQKVLVTAELRRIGSAVARMDRAEWFRFALGGIMTVALTSGLGGTLAATVVRWGMTAFFNLATGGTPPAFLPPGL